MVVGQGRRCAYVAFFLEGRETGGMLGELVRPEDPVGVELAHPMLLHVGEEIELAVGPEPRLNGFALVCWDGGAARLAVGGVGGGLGVILPA